jgi:deoxyribodipyrimidine photo-lyase
MPRALVWFRQDLRCDDHPALVAASEQGEVVPVFIWAPEEEGDWAPGAASMWWLHHALSSLQQALSAVGSRLIIRRGPALATLLGLARECDSSAVYWTRRYEPACVERDTAVKHGLRDAGLVAESFNGALLHEPWTVRSGQGTPFRVFTPFWRACLAKGEPAEPAEAPPLRGPRRWPSSITVEALQLLPTVDWAGGLRSAWEPGEPGARRVAACFIAKALAGYGTQRDIPGAAGTSRLSPHLHWGEISPRRLWHLLGAAGRRQRIPAADLEKYRAELGWREFAHHLLHHAPQTVQRPLRSEFSSFPWREDPTQLRAWQRGQTGYPLVDAGLRELWHTGWIHNRVRMVVASFLVKHLLLPWQEGARWFWETLVDADLANNTLGWQWTAGCGADAAPFFRIFNPVTQGERFDADGSYIRRWVPELARLPGALIHAPWEAPPAALAAAGVTLGREYPFPIVDHKAARERALAALAMVTGGRGAAEGH